MAELGWTEGATVEFLVRYARGDYKLWGTIAAEILEQKVDLVLAPFGPLALAAMKLTKVVPIVFCIVEDPVAMGLVASLGRPGGNLTGVITGGVGLIAKRLQSLKELVPSIRRLGIVQPSDAPSQTLAEVAELGRAAKQLGIEIVIAKLDSRRHSTRDVAIPYSRDLAVALNQLLREGVGGTVGTISMHWSRRKEFPGIVAKAGLPAIYDAEEFVDAGGLMSLKSPPRPLPDAKPAGSGDERIARAQRGKPRKIAVHGPQFPHAMMQAQRGDARIVDRPALDLAANRNLLEPVEVTHRFADELAPRGFAPGTDGVERHAQGRRRRVDARMRHHGTEFVHARPGDRPAAAAVGQIGEQLERRGVRTGSRAVRVNQKVGVNRDHGRFRRAVPSRGRP